MESKKNWMETPVRHSLYEEELLKPRKDTGNRGFAKKRNGLPGYNPKGIDWTLGSDIQGEKRRENFSAFERLCQNSLPPSLF